MSKLNTHVFLKGICWVVHWEIIFNLGGFGVFFNFSVENVLEESQALVGNHLGWEREAARWEGIKRNPRAKPNRSQGFPAPVRAHLFLSQKEAVFSFPLLSSCCGISRIHPSTWIFPEPDVFCLQDRTNLAAVWLEAEQEHSWILTPPGAPEGCHLFLYLRILLAGLAAFSWTSRQREKWLFPFFFRIISPHTSVAPVVIRRKLLFFPVFFFHEPVRQRKIWLEWGVLKGEIKQRLRHRNWTSKYFCICRAAEPGRRSHIPTSPRPKGWKIPCEESKLITLPLIIRIINDLILYWYRISMGWIRSVQAQLKEMILTWYLMPKQSVTTILDLKLVLSLSLDCSEKCFFTEELRGLKKILII